MRLRTPQILDPSFFLAKRGGVKKFQDVADAILTVACSGTGYIGSFTSLVLLENGYDVVIVDNLYNSSMVALDRIELICGKRPVFYQVDVTDEPALDHVFAKHPAIDSVIHFAALKVGCFPPPGSACHGPHSSRG